jgi:hypothetical protein
MSNRAQAGVIAFVALTAAGGAFFWVHIRAERAHRDAASASELVVTQPAAEPSQPGKNESPPSEAPKPSLAPGVALPRPGEVLEFSADVSKLSRVANLRLQVVGRRDFSGKNTWHLQAFAHTESPLRMIFELDDQFDSYSDAENFSSLQYEMHLNERGQKQDSVQRLVTANEPAPADATATRVLPGTRDPLGLMQYLRNTDWSKAREVRSPVYDGHKLYDVRASLAAASQDVSVPAGNFQASKVRIRVFDNGAEMKDAQFSLYLANNASRTPVLLEAVLPFATARVELVKGK